MDDIFWNTKYLLLEIISWNATITKQLLEIITWNAIISPTDLSPSAFHTISLTSFLHHLHQFKRLVFPLFHFTLIVFFLLFFWLFFLFILFWCIFCNVDKVYSFFFLHNSLLKLIVFFWIYWIFFIIVLA